MFIIVHSKEFNAPFLIVSKKGRVEDSSEREKYISLWNELAHGKLVMTDAQATGHKKIIRGTTYFCCRWISSVTDTAGRKLPFIFFFQKEDSLTSFAPHLKTLEDLGYTLAEGEFDLICRFAAQMQQKDNPPMALFKMFWDFIKAMVNKIPWLR